MKIEDMKPTFMLRIEDKRYLHLGLLPRDKVMCDHNCMQPARLVVAVWDDYAHICSLAGTRSSLTRKPMPRPLIMRLSVAGCCI